MWNACNYDFIQLKLLERLSIHVVKTFIVRLHTLFLDFVFHFMRILKY